MAPEGRLRKFLTVEVSITSATRRLSILIQSTGAVGWCILRKSIPVKKFRATDGNATPFSERKGDSRPDGFFEINQKALSEMAKNCEVLMKKEGWKDVPKPSESSHRTTNETKESLQPSTNAGEKPKRPPPPPIYRITSPQEFKKKSFQSSQDIIKLMWNMSRILALDPCRRFTLGFTIENRSFRLWMILNRGTILRSQAFDFFEDQYSLVRVFLSFAFSSAGNMGWDPTITFSHCDSDNRRQYNIIVDEKVYRTVTTLSDYPADNPLGRAARVWKVEDAKGNTRVLKDLWLEHDRLEEHQIYENIVKDVEQSAEPGFEEETMNAVVPHLLTPLGHCRVKVSGIADDDTTLVMLRGYDIKKAQATDLMRPSQANPAQKQSFAYSLPHDQDAEYITQTSQDSGFQVPQRVVLQETRKIPNDQRYHYRIVFKECATTIYDERSLSNIILALADVLIALQFIHSAGWVHRDISGGNLYYYKDRGLIGDLEYAKKVEDQSHHNVRTGTPHFMASEALSNRYLFYPIVPNPFTSLPQRRLFKFVPDDVPASNVVKPAAPSFNHNALHDIESVWWVLVYTVLINDDAASQSQNTSVRQKLMNKLFDGQLNNNSRLPFLRDPDFEKCLPSSFSSLAPALREYAELLIAAFSAAEKNYPTIEPLAIPLIHSQCTHGFTRGILEKIKDVKMVYVKFRAEDVPGFGQKRFGEHLDEPEGSHRRKSR
ncbi:hypothetical protein DFH05DRAFT_1524227 [Lentinula detonsa]|uniref:Protein kinase domain-containing protein n=1 Tax=Lentinula detonsa TaxID=2804962 RepID=A0A9W8P144_9AGAR|nr:hypothetical protein DFH05DRAFT_1524227 [Lentinula detonsa]